MIRPLAVLLTLTTLTFADGPPAALLTLDDQFDRKQDLKTLRGDVVVVLYGDKDGMPSNKTLGEKLHVQFHPTAKDMPPAKAATAPVTPVAEGKRGPDVKIVPVACIGSVPEPVKRIIRNSIKREAPEVPVWLDFESKMKDGYGLKEGQPNLVLVDAAGRIRMKVAGELDAATYARLVKAIEFLRQEAVAVK